MRNFVKEFQQWLEEKKEGIFDSISSELPISSKLERTEIFALLSVTGMARLLYDKYYKDESNFSSLTKLICLITKQKFDKNASENIRNIITNSSNNSNPVNKKTLNNLLNEHNYLDSRKLRSEIENIIDEM
jgi:hypothetical protein